MSHDWLGQCLEMKRSALKGMACPDNLMVPDLEGNSWGDTQEWQQKVPQSKGT